MVEDLRYRRRSLKEFPRKGDAGFTRVGFVVVEEERRVVENDERL